jgi:hypothetical protein
LFLGLSLAGQNINFDSLLLQRGGLKLRRKFFAFACAIYFEPVYVMDSTPFSFITEESCKTAGALPPVYGALP